MRRSLATGVVESPGDYRRLPPAERVDVVALSWQRRWLVDQQQELSGASLLGFAAVSLGCGVVGLAALHSGASAVIPLVCLPFTAVLAYFGVARLVNRVTVELTADALCVRHGPVPWWPKRLRRLAIVCIEVGTREAGPWRTYGTTGRRWQRPSRAWVQAVLDDGSRVILLDKVQSGSRAQAVASLLGKLLHDSS